MELQRILECVKQQWRVLVCSTHEKACHSGETFRRKMSVKILVPVRGHPCRFDPLSNAAHPMNNHRIVCTENEVTNHVSNTRSETAPFVPQCSAF